MAYYRFMIDAINDTCEYTPTERRKTRRYLYEMAATACLYVVLVFISIRTVEHVSGLAKYLVAVLPVFGGAAMAWAIVRYALGMDEFQRQAATNAGAISAIVTAVFTMALGFLENAGLPRISLTWVWPIAVIVWGFSMPFVSRGNR
jgi:hypothetical protein